MAPRSAVSPPQVAVDVAFSSAAWQVDAFAASLTSSADNTVAAYPSDVVAFVEWAQGMGAASPAAVDRLFLRRYVAALTTQGLAKRSVARKVSALRRYFAYLPEYEAMHQISTIGSWILAAGLFTALFSLLGAFGKNAKKAGNNPWNAVSLEWQTQSPPIEHNFHETPHVTTSPYDFPEIDKSGGVHH